MSPIDESNIKTLVLELHGSMAAVKQLLTDHGAIFMRLEKKADEAADCLEKAEEKRQNIILRIVALEENIGEESIGKTVSTMQAHTTDIMVTVADIKKDIEEIYKSTNLCSKACVERISILEVKAVNSERGRAALWGVLIFVLSGLGTLILHHIFGGK